MARVPVYFFLLFSLTVLPAHSQTPKPSTYKVGEIMHSFRDGLKTTHGLYLPRYQDPAVSQAALEKIDITQAKRELLPWMEKELHLRSNSTLGDLNVPKTDRTDLPTNARLLARLRGEASRLFEAGSRRNPSGTVLAATAIAGGQESGWVSRLSFFQRGKVRGLELRESWDPAKGKMTLVSRLLWKKKEGPPMVFTQILGNPQEGLGQIAIERTGGWKTTPASYRLRWLTPAALSGKPIPGTYRQITMALSELSPLRGSSMLCYPSGQMMRVARVMAMLLKR